MSTNQAAWLDGAGSTFRVAEAPMPKAAPGRVIIRNKAVAVNPVDWKIQTYGGGFIKKWPTVLGCDIAGEVVEVGEGVTNVKKGDRVTAHTVSLMTNEPTDGGFLHYSSAQAATTASIPSSLSFNDACVIPLAFDTAAVGLFLPADQGYLGLPQPSLNPSPSGKTIVVWGGSSSVGALTIQLAVAGGSKVVATASSHNSDLCKKCGASEVIEYKSQSAAEDVVSAVKKVGGTFVGVYDAISESGKSYEQVMEILDKFGGGNLATVLPPPKDLPSNVKTANILGINEMTHKLWQEYIPEALKTGQLQAVPEPLVVGKGLESVQKGLDENKKGVSAKKVVIEL